MSVQEVKIERVVRAVFAAAALCFATSNAAYSWSIDCSEVAYRRFVIVSAFLALAALFIYTKTRVLSRGALDIDFRIARRVASLVLLIELALHLVALSSAECPRAASMAAVPMILAVFYTVVFLVLVFGDRFLGRLRSLARIGVVPPRKY